MHRKQQSLVYCHGAVGGPTQRSRGAARSGFSQGNAIPAGTAVLQYQLFILPRSFTIAASLLTTFQDSDHGDIQLTSGQRGGQGPDVTHLGATEGVPSTAGDESELASRTLPAAQSLHTNTLEVFPRVFPEGPLARFNIGGFVVQVEIIGLHVPNPHWSHD